MLAEKVVVNLPAERVYPSLLDYLKNHPLTPTSKVVRSEPSYIEVKFGSWWDGGVPDIVKIDILPQNDKSEILIDFNFTQLFIPYIVYGFFWLSLLIYMFIHSTGKNPLDILMTLSLMVPFSGAAHHITKRRKSIKNGISDYFLGMERATSPDQES